MENTKYIQLGICGIAENKELNDALELPTKEIKRVELARFIRNNGLTKLTFARIAEVSPATISKWLYTDTVPSIKVVKRIATRFGVSIEDVDELFEAG